MSHNACYIAGVALLAISCCRATATTTPGAQQGGGRPDCVPRVTRASLGFCGGPCAHIAPTTTDPAGSAESEQLARQAVGALLGDFLGPINGPATPSIYGTTVFARQAVARGARLGYITSPRLEPVADPRLIRLKDSIELARLCKKAEVPFVRLKVEGDYWFRNSPGARYELTYGVCDPSHGTIEDSHKFGYIFQVSECQLIAVPIASIS